MNDLIPSDPKSTEEGVSSLSALVEYGSQLTLPVPIKKNLLKALDQLCSAAVDVPIAYLEGLAAERRAEAEGRVKIIQAVSNKIAAGSDPSTEYAEVASRRVAAKIVREQVNLHKIAESAVQDIASRPSLESDSRQEQRRIPEPDISPDWLNAFEREAAEKTSDEMRTMFGRILAEEIRRPSSFSVRTVRLIGQLDPEVAKMFQRLCSLCVSLEIGGEIVDARVCSLDGQAGANSLMPWGLHFDALNILQEHGFIVPDYNCWVDYAPSIARGGKVQVPFRFGGRKWGFISNDLSEIPQEIKVHGVALSKSGKELFRIVDKLDGSDYWARFQAFLEKKGLKVALVSS